MATKRISALTELASITNGDNPLAIEDIDAGTTKKAKASTIKAYVLEGGAIGGTSAGDIADIDSAQTFTNKRLTSPQLNEAVAVTATATEVNKLAGCTTSTAELNKLTGVTVLPAEINRLAGVNANIQTQINNLSAEIPSTEARTHTYGLGFSQAIGVTTKTRTQAEILTDMGLSTSAYVIDHTSMVLSLHIVNAGIYSVVPFESAGVKYEYSTQTLSAQLQLDTITISGLAEEKAYNLAMTFKINLKSGV